MRYFLLLFTALFACDSIAQTILYEDQNGPQTLNFLTTSDGRNIYNSGTNPDIIVTNENDTWFIRSKPDGDPIGQGIFFSEVNTNPNPPSLATGNWQAIDGGTLLVFEGSGTTTPVSLSDFGSYCMNDGVITDLGGGQPAGGVYIGPGVTDDGNGSTFSFDPMETGAAIHTVTYIVNDDGATANIVVLSAPSVTFDPLDPIDFRDYDSGTPPTSIGSVAPAGGVFTGPAGLVLDDGNGETFSINPDAFSNGTYTITYTYSNSDGCTDQMTQGLTVFTSEVLGDYCTNAVDISAFLPDRGDTIITPVWDNTNLLADGDPTYGYDCFATDSDGNQLSKTFWMSFGGTGDDYQIKTVDCAGVIDYANALQMASYSFECTTALSLSCTDQTATEGLTIASDATNVYRLMVDEVNSVDGRGQYCLQIVNQTMPVSTDSSPASDDIELFPNPTNSNSVTLTGFTGTYRLVDLTGQVLQKGESTGHRQMSLIGIPSGLYLIELHHSDQTTKIQKLVIR